MSIVLSAIGYFIIVFGLFIGVANHVDLSIVLSSIIGGVFFLALGKIIDILEKIEKKLPERSYSEEFPATEFKVRSNDY